VNSRQQHLSKQQLDLGLELRQMAVLPNKPTTPPPPLAVAVVATPPPRPATHGAAAAQTQAQTLGDVKAALMVCV